MSNFEDDFKAACNWNCSALFLTQPIVGMTLSKLVIDFGMENAFLEDEMNEEYTGDLLFILLHPTHTDILDVLIAQQEQNNINFIGEYDYPDGYVVLVYAIPEEMKSDFIKFKEGKYSEMSLKYKELFDYTVTRNGKPEKSLQFMVLYKDKEFKDNLEGYLGVTIDNNSELWQPPSLSDKEILKISKYVTTTTSNRETKVTESDFNDA